MRYLRTATNIFVHQNRLSFCKPVSKRPYPDTCLRTDLQHATVDYSHSCHLVRHRTRIRLRRINGNTAPQRCCKPAEWTYYFVDKLLSGACPKWNIYRNRFNHVIMDGSYTDRQHRTKLQCNLAGKTPPFSLSQNNRLFSMILLLPLLIVISSGLTIFMTTYIKNMDNFLVLALSWNSW